MENQVMQITRKSAITGKLNTMDIPVTAEELEAFTASRQVIRDFLSRLTPEQREFVLSGVTPEELQANAIEF
jgi:hypothetical protein